MVLYLKIITLYYFPPRLRWPVGDVMMCPCYNNLKTTGSAKRELREDVITNKISII